MTIGVLVTVSCVLTSITMLIFSAALFILIQSGSRGAQALVNRLFGFGRDKNEDEKLKESPSTARARSQVSSADTLRQRAQQMDFAPQAAVQSFNAQAAPQQATFSSRDPLSMPQQNTQFGQPQAQFGQVNPSMPTLSSARPYQAGQQPLGGQTQYGQTPQYGQQPLGNTSQQFRPQSLGGQTQYGQTPPLGQQPLGTQPQQYGQQPLGGQRPLGTQPQQYGQQSLGGQPTYNPQQGQYGQQPLGGQRPLGNPPQSLGNQQPLGGQPQYNQQSLGNQPPAQNPLGNYAPPPRSRASANIDNQNTAPASGLRGRRDSRRSDRDEIYDDSQGGIGGIIDDLGNLIP